MSLAGYKRHRDAWIAGDDRALARMITAVTPAVSDRLGHIERSAAAYRRLAAERAGQASQLARLEEVTQHLAAQASRLEHREDDRGWVLADLLTLVLLIATLIAALILS